MSRLRTAVKELAKSLSEACPTQQLQSLSEGEGQVVLKVLDSATDKTIVINVVIFDPDEYPRSGALVQVDGNGSSSGLADRLSAISERFQDGAQLCSVLTKVCGVLDIPVEEDMLRAAEKRAAAAGGKQIAEEESGSAMENDASDDDPMSEDYPASSDEGGSDDGGFDGLVDDAEEKELMVQCGQRQGRWERFEEELATATAKQQGLSMEQGKASKQQIFSSKEAFRMLSKELLGFIRRQFLGQDTNVSADSAGDDLYTWNVELWRSAFRPDCQLAKDLQEVSNKFATSSIQLRVSFMRGLHPFYPPRVEVVRPHLSTPLPGALASHPLLRLEHWDPTMTMPELVDNIRAFLEENGRIDVSDPRNSAAQFPSSSFSQVQLALARLEAMTDVKPACYSRFARLYDGRSTHGRPVDAGDVGEATSFQAQQAKKARTNEANAGQANAAAPGDAQPAPVKPAAGVDAVWAKGTGYGYGGGHGGRGKPAGPVWDPKAAATAQEAQDEQLCSVLQALASALAEEFPSSSSSSSSGGGGDGRSTPAAASGAGAGPSAAGSSCAAAEAGPSSSSRTSGSSGRRRKQPGGSEAMDATLSGSQEQIISALNDSVLQPLLVREMSQKAFPEMVDRHQYFKPLLSIVESLCHPAFENFLAGNALADQQQQATAAAAARSSRAAARQHGRVCSVIGAVRGLQKGAAIVKKELTKALEQQAAGASSSTKVDKQAELVKQQAQTSLQVADMVLSIINKVQHLTTAEQAAAAQPAAAAAQAAPARRTTRAAAAAAAAAAGGGAAAAAEQDPASRAAAYVAELKSHVLDTAAIATFHRYKTDADQDPMGLKARVQRVTSEMAGIERLIEVNESSSIFVRVDEDNTFLWRVLIIGPEDTPYSGGAFLFDMFFPPNYPAVPPKVVITTTGGGTVRFNPNLYDCGKVCLSLLGTWSGAQGESWSPEASSAFQVLVSIQSLILVPEPYFNEPGYEQRSNTSESKRYNVPIREATIKWAMIDQLQKPPPEFAEVIRTHFKLRAPYILKQVTGWIDEASAASEVVHKNRLQTLKSQLETELKKLT